MQLTDFTSRSWKELSAWEWDYLRLKGVCNGCGGKGENFKNRLIRSILRWSLRKLRLIFIEASCDIHDFSYWQGGDEDRRLECDLGFFTAIIGDIGKSDLKSISVIKYTLLSLCFYYSVRVGGKDYFRYS